MKKISFSIVFALVSIFGHSIHAQAANMVSLTPLGHSLEFFANRGGSGYTFHAHWGINDMGPHHTCQVKWTSNGWASHSVGSANFSHVEGSREIWTFRTNVPGSGGVEYVIMCQDLDKTIRIVESSGITRTTHGFELQSPVRRVQ